MAAPSEPRAARGGGRSTIWQVAAAAGVSHQTVSRYLHGESLRPENRERVARAIEELDYRPNLSARSMRTRRTQRVGVLLPAVSSFQATTLSGAIDAATEAGYVVEVSSVDGDARLAFDRALALADSGQVDGVLALAPLPPETQDRYPGRAAIVASADYDDQAHSTGAMADGACLAELVEGLHALGHRRFLHVTGDLEYASARSRRQVFEETIRRLGLGEPRVHEGIWNAESGRSAIIPLPEEDRPTAVIAGSDAIAAGVIEGARQRGWRIPEDLSVTGWDDLPLGAHMQPTLTTVKDDRRRLGREAMLRLLAAIREEPLPQEQPSLTHVIWRGSTGPAPR
ncbi:LacI family transcriptional regulator [Brachybacterium sp. NBEC-018]|uniref:LacI family DNA-binding transcriptional regulator n=1 Tax=Brachybacterium sp. NBEC-018 TaxID=2996004 RepID=UPI002174D3B3|nr:LacI family DNA-binding transcriptional regulator [Brachybacterium sp. NBEC-018]UVY84817.1 LacI family transcriptional regulator [Brachybacterium sp. NBEC-018]